MADDDLRVVTHGVKELSKALRQIDKAAPKALAAGFKAIAQHVVDATKPKVARDSGRAANSLKARGSTRGGAIAFGGNAAPHYPFLDFGGSVSRGHVPGKAWSGAVKREWRGNPNGEGRYLYPTIRDNRDYITKEVDEMVEGLARNAGFETKD